MYENTRFDIAIIGTGPAGISAALTAKARNKKFVIFGSLDFTDKLAKNEHQVFNYPGFYGKTGKELVEAFRKDFELAGITINQGHVSNIINMGNFFGLSVGSENYEAKTVIITSGINFGKPLVGEKDFLGKGVSYCATCDAMLFRGKPVAVTAYSKTAVEEANFLAEIVSKVYFIPMYDFNLETSNLNEKIEVIKGSVDLIEGDKVVNKIVIKTDVQTQKDILVNCVFILRDAVAPDDLLMGLETEKNHIKVDRNMQTNIPGVFAAGDVTGTPYQYVKAAGEGNIAVLSATEYLKTK